jgi:hypothetical protein
MKSMSTLLRYFSGAVLLLAIAVSVNAQTAQTFPSPDDAVKGLIAAARARDQGALDRIFAPNLSRLRSGDPVQEAEEMARFVESASEKTELTKVDETRYVLETGNDGWPFPVPIVKRGDRWAFDSSQGVSELLARRVGRNELATMLTCAAYAVAQWDYFLDGDWNNDGVQEFAQKLVSAPGQKDGLYWPTGANDDPSPLGPLAAYAHAEGYGSKSTAFHGYHFKILKAQGPAAAGGRYSYLINSRMIAGFALVAYPATYGSSGVMTFIVNQQGKLYQKNLGPNTAKIAQAMTVYNPDRTWDVADYESALLKLP